MKQPSLRERSKARRRTAIERSAWRLFAEHGYEATTILDIAADAEVSPRTVTLYFPTKADLALARVREAANRLEAEFSPRRGQTSALEVLARWLRDEFEQVDADTAAALHAAFAANPPLRGMQSMEISAAVEKGTRALAAELGKAADSLVVELLRGAIVGAVSEAFDARARGHDPEQVVSTVTALLRAARAVAEEGPKKPARRRSPTAPRTGGGTRSAGAPGRRPSSGTS